MARTKRKTIRHLFRITIALAGLLLSSCSLFEKQPAVLWTDTPEILIAVEMFNASQSRHLVEVHYVGDLPNTLRQTGETPSLVIGKGIKTEVLTDYFQSLEYLFGELVLSKGSFYPKLLDGGTMNNRQLLVPVSFNTLLVLNKKESVRLENPSVITMDEIKKLASEFNEETDGKPERIGFSPRWPDKDFLFQWIQWQGADFAERPLGQSGKSSSPATYPITWNAQGLDAAVAALRNYTNEVNTSVETEDAFSFKYLFAPGYKNVESEKILFTAMDSASYFLLPAGTRSMYDYRYFAVKNRIAVSESIRYAGIPRKAPNKESAEQFLRWFFNPDNQKAILEKSRSLRLSESAFGIAGGFSSLQQVTETVFPAYYTDLLGHTPPKAMLTAPQPIPPSWDKLKGELILPWLNDFPGKARETSPDADFRAHLDEYLKKNPDFQ